MSTWSKPTTYPRRVYNAHIKQANADIQRIRETLAAALPAPDAIHTRSENDPVEVTVGMLHQMRGDLWMIQVWLDAGPRSRMTDIIKATRPKLGGHIGFSDFDPHGVIRD